MKKGLLLLFLILGVLMAVSVSASPLDMISDGINFVFSAIGGAAFLGAVEFAGLLKILYGAFLFVILYAASELIRDYLKQGPAVAVALILAILIALVTPTSLLLTLITTYAVLVMGVLFGGVVGGIAWFGFATRTKTAGLFIAKLISIFLGFWIVAQFTTSVLNMGGTFVQDASATIGAAGSVVDFFSDWAPIVFVILLIWTLIDFIFLAGREHRGGSDTAASSDDPAAGTASERRSGLRTRLAGWFDKNFRAEEEFTENEILEIRNAQRGIQEVERRLGTVSGVPGREERSREILRQIITYYDQHVRNPLRNANKWERKTIRIGRQIRRKESREGSITAEEQAQLAAIEAIGNHINEIVTASTHLESELNQLRTLLGATPAPDRSRITGARDAILGHLRTLRDSVTNVAGQLAALVPGIRRGRRGRGGAGGSGDTGGYA
jgi:hypothetical protein